ncbi:hypothetical protein AB0C15_19730 [Micromonospora sp. NPDC048835]|uniref:hypothetical protein n=1 Tax=Micromonospora sp. NPDC048835 TaxID=3155147 RepID=UPI0033D05BA7
MNNSGTVGLEYMTDADLYKGPSDFVSNPGTFYRPVEMGAAIRFSTPPNKSSEYRKALKNLKDAVKRGPDPGLQEYQRNDLGRLVGKMDPETPPRNADHAFNMMWYLRVNVRDYPTSGPTFQKIESFYNLHSPQLVYDKYHRPPASNDIEPSRSQGDVAASGDLGRRVGWREKAKIGTSTFVELASMQMTGAVHFSYDGDEKFGTRLRDRFNNKVHETKRARGLK